MKKIVNSMTQGGREDWDDCQYHDIKIERGWYDCQYHDTMKKIVNSMTQGGREDWDDCQYHDTKRKGGWVDCQTWLLYGMRLEMQAAR